MIKIHAIRTGQVKVKQFQTTGAKNQLSRIWQLFFSRKWSDWLPVYCFLVEHPDGPFLVDSGEIAKVNERGYLPDNPVFRASVRYDVKREDEVDRQLALLGFKTDQIKAVFLTHLHSDHVDGVCHFPNAKIYVSKEAWEFAMCPKGESLGYFRRNLPDWFQPEIFDFDDGEESVFKCSKHMSADESIIAVPLPGHSVGHTAYIIKSDNIKYVLSGDATYNESTVRDKIPFVILNNAGAEASVHRLYEYSQSASVVVLCSHNPGIALK